MRDSIKEWKPKLVVMPHVPLSDSCSLEDMEHAIKTSISELFASDKKIMLAHYATVPWPDGRIDSFTIHVNNTMVMHRIISVKFKTQLECEICLPLGWWWKLPELNEKITEKDAQVAAIEEHKNAHSDIINEFTAKIEQKVIWPERPGHIAYEVYVSAEGRFAVTYFISAFDGSTLGERHTVQTVVAAKQGG